MITVSSLVNKNLKNSTKYWKLIPEEPPIIIHRVTDLLSVTTNLKNVSGSKINYRSVTVALAKNFIH